MLVAIPGLRRVWIIANFCDLDIYMVNDEHSKKMFEYLTMKEGMFPNVSFFVPSFFSSDVSP